MTRDETVALFLECEAKRAEARTAALAGGKSEDAAKIEAHEAAKAHWNAWAEGVLAERKAMEADGRWAAEKDWKGDLEPRNEETRAWMKKAAVDFSRVRFETPRSLRAALSNPWAKSETPNCQGAEALRDGSSVEPPVQSIQLETDIADFSGFVFPSDASFENATFSGDAAFEKATFFGNARFVIATFTANAYFDSATFTGGARFDSAIFAGNAYFVIVTLGGIANFDSTTVTGDIYFDRATFTGIAMFESATFNGNTWFERATFTGAARFDSATFTDSARFNSATFTEDAMFENTDFAGDAQFESATFSGDALFARATFSGDADFKSTIFLGLAYFETAAFFSGYAYFENVTFPGDAYFRGATFSGDAYFESATFSGDSAIFSGEANFESATFQGFTGFGGVTFRGATSFTGIKVERALNMTGAKFEKVPSFNQADFKQSPDLDAVDFPLPGFWRRGEAGLIPHYRAIRRMAIQGADYEREQMAFKGETRSKRGTEHKPWHTAFWFGIAYDALSDYGRSIARPLMIWLASAIAFAAIYAWNAGVAVSGWFSACADDGASKALKALTLSAANSLPLIGSSRGEVAAEFYTKCLKLEHVPAWSPILQIWQTLWSAVLLFLFLLALRNQFKIK